MPLPPPPAFSDRDADQLNLLGIFNFVLAGLGVVGLGFIALHFTIMHMVFSQPQFWKQMKDQQGNSFPFDPQQFFAAFQYVYLLIGAWGIVSIVLNLAAGIQMRQARGRTFLFVVAAFNCINFPFGTALGIFTLVVLTRDSVRVRFESV